MSIKPVVTTDKYIKPQQPKGQLVQSTIVPSPKTVLSDMKYDLKAVKDSYAGKANDHQLGKLNDVGMKVGAVALAAFLATQKATTKTKLMEFVGVGTFFGAMKLWPKLAIGLPSKAIHGFDPTQEYADSFGRKKPFFQDPQYTPWDVYSNEELQKIGDKMGVDKNAQDRNDLTKANMKKIATKNNTLWMLTAGVASAVFSALACNKAEKVIDPALDKINNNRANDLLNNYETAAQKRQSNDLTNKLNKIYETNKNQVIDEKLMTKISETISKGFDPITAGGIDKDLRKMLISGNSYADEKLAEKIVDESQKVLESRLGKEQTAKFMPDKEQMIKHFETEKVLGKELDNDKKTALRVSIARLIHNNAKAQGMEIDNLKVVKKSVSEIAEVAINESGASKLDEKAMKKLNEVAKVMSEFNAKATVLDEYAQMKVADKPETVIANYWNEVSSSLVKTMKIDFKELEKVRHNRELVQELVRDKIEKVTSNDAEYTRVIGEISNKIAELNKKIKPEETKKYLETVTKTYDDAATKFYNLGMGETSEKLTAFSVNGKGSLKRVKTAFYQERIMSVKSSFARLINMFDAYRRISKGEIPKDGSSREVKEAMIELVKQTTLQGHSSDHSIKFHFNRNPNPNADNSDIEIKDGKVINKYYSKDKGVDVPNDYKFYQNAMNFMYNSNMDKVTEEALKKAGIENDVKTYNKEVFEKIGGADYFPKPNHKTTGDQGTSSEYKFLLLGVAPDEMFTKTVQNTYNSQKWGKTFGTIGGILTAVTVAAQFLFGKGKAVK